MQKMWSELRRCVVNCENIQAKREIKETMLTAMGAQPPLPRSGSNSPKKGRSNFFIFLFMFF
jgi:hypothetical protein